MSFALTLGERLHPVIRDNAQAGSVFEPLSADEAGKKADRAAHPVADHRDPDTDCAHSEMHRKHVAERQTDEHHGRDRAQHRIAHIVRGAQDIRQSERRRPEENRAAIMNGNQDKAERVKNV